ncbi:hypothetical protein L1D52_23985 [Vibrio brasiliensis]|uniref:hypothetical protein n=1 Tax=Vibrio brasiliensis TaxID=170652 RepID=UPI001EFE9F7F|nr:hypothetical protein [Vibrio brasiliensis]MCG9785372.1 hypothetical protein [Vibrio brasiliensis]
MLEKDLLNVPEGAAICVYYGNNNINNRRAKVVKTGSAGDGLQFAVLKIWLHNKERYDLKLIDHYNWHIHPWRIVETTENVDEWIKGE